MKERFKGVKVTQCLNQSPLAVTQWGVDILCLHLTHALAERWAENSVVSYGVTKCYC